MLKLVAANILLVAATGWATPVQLHVNRLATPLGIDTPRPEFSWISDAKTPNWRQSAYEVLVGSNAAQLRPGASALWDSGRVAGGESLGIMYAGMQLQARQRYLWKVITWDQAGRRTESAAAWFETGMLSAADWQAKWIERKDPVAEQELDAMRWIWLPGMDATHVPSSTRAQFRYELSLEELPRAASLHVLARGKFVARVNGVETGRHVDWGAFDREEIRPWLHAGKNEIEIEMTSRPADQGADGAPAAMAASLRMTFANGSEQRTVSDSRWQARQTEEEAWKPAHSIGPLSLPFGFSVEGKQPVPGPDRISTDVALLRKSFSVTGRVVRGRLTITALGLITPP